MCLFLEAKDPALLTALTTQTYPQCQAAAAVNSLHSVPSTLPRKPIAFVAHNTLFHTFPPTEQRLSSAGRPRRKRRYKKNPCRCKNEPNGLKTHTRVSLIRSHLVSRVHVGNITDGTLIVMSKISHYMIMNAAVGFTRRILLYY